MDLHSQLILDEYDAKKESYEILKDIVIGELKKIVDGLGMYVCSIEGRVKTRKSLAGKLELKGFKYKTITDITDIVGCRVVTFYNDHIDKVAGKVTEVFDIDWDNSIDKRKSFQIDQFGYMSLHYICRIPETLYKNDDHPEINQLHFEIQIRSVLQHTWATIYHDTGYKNDVEVPKEYLRQLNRLAGILELADESFMNIRNQISEYRKKVKQAFSSGNLEDIELNGDSFNAYISSKPYDSLNKRIASINNMDIEECNLKNLLVVYKNIGCVTIKDVVDFNTKYFEFAYEFAVREFEDTDIDIISEITGPFIEFMCYTIEQGYGEVGILQLLTTLYGERRSNSSLAKKYFNIGKQMGLVKEI